MHQTAIALAARPPQLCHPYHPPRSFLLVTPPLHSCFRPISPCPRSATSCSSCESSSWSQPNTNSSSVPPTSQVIKTQLLSHSSLFRDSDNWHQPPNLFRPQSHRFQQPYSTDSATGTSSLRFPRRHPQQRRSTYALIVPDRMELLQNFPLHLQPPVPFFRRPNTLQLHYITLHLPIPSSR